MILDLTIYRTVYTCEGSDEIICCEKKSIRDLVGFLKLECRSKFKLSESKIGICIETDDESMHIENNLKPYQKTRILHVLKNIDSYKEQWWY